MLIAERPGLARKVWKTSEIRYTIFIFFVMLFILRFFFDLVIFIYVDMCMCESDHRWRPLCGA